VEQFTEDDVLQILAFEAYEKNEKVIGGKVSEWIRGLLGKVEERCARAYKECKRNVDQYIQDIDLLIKNKRYHRAISFAIITQEEVVKAAGFLFFSRIESMIEIPKEWTKLLHKSHEIKIMLGELILSSIYQVDETLKGKIPDVLKKEAESSKTKEELVEKAIGRLYGTVAPPILEKIKKMHPKYYKLAAKIQKLKERGLYVDIRRGKISTPFDATEEEVKKEVEKLNEAYGILQKIEQMPDFIEDRFLPRSPEHYFSDAGAETPLFVLLAHAFAIRDYVSVVVKICA